jgi:outer membrane protein assembly factor BamB
LGLGLWHMLFVEGIPRLPSHLSQSPPPHPAHATAHRLSSRHCPLVQAQTSSSQTVYGPGPKASITWTSDAGGSVPVLGADGVLFVASGEGLVSGLNATTGASVWSTSMADRSSSSPALVNGFVVCGCDDYQLYSCTLPCPVL